MRLAAVQEERETMQISLDKLDRPRHPEDRLVARGGRKASDHGKTAPYPVENYCAHCWTNGT